MTVRRKVKSIFTLLAFLVPISVSAQMTIDVGKISCSQFLKYKITQPDNLSIWLSGYFHGKTNSTLLEREDFKENITKLKKACILSENSELPVMQMAEKLFVRR
jgi:HdeA/HdeB family protein